MNLAVQPDQPKSEPHPAWMVASLVSAAAVGLVVLAGYWISATVELFDCVNLISDAPYPPSHVEGGEDSSVWVAAVLTGAAWVGAWRITTGTRLRRWPPLLVVVFVALDLAALAALWNLAPIIWGPEHCVPD